MANGDDNNRRKKLFRRYRNESGTLDRFEIALTSMGVIALRRELRTSVPHAPIPVRMLSDTVGFFMLPGANE